MPIGQYAFTLGDNDSPHAMAMNCFLSIYRSCFDINYENMLIKKIESSVEAVLEKNGQEPYSKGVTLHEDFGYFISGQWEVIDHYEGDSFQDPDGNYVVYFQKHSKYVAGSSNAYYQFWSENKGMPVWYQFPAVAYSFDEIQAWFVWSIKRIMPVFPHQKVELTNLMLRHVDIDRAITLLQKKLDGEIPWEFGPARIREPKMILWHERTRDKKMNDWIRQWID
jgi:phenylpropionate dioxygenase-like ring-hydroxylating dioxygenase large terminal subunit